MLKVLNMLKMLKEFIYKNLTINLGNNFLKEL